VTLLRRSTLSDSVCRHDVSLNFKAERFQRAGGQIGVTRTIAGRVVGGLANERGQKFDFGVEAIVDRFQKGLRCHSVHQFRDEGA
jgi:hypothetical protein